MDNSRKGAKEQRQYLDYEDDETCLAPCKDRKWYLFGRKDRTRQMKHAEYCRRYRRKISALRKGIKI